VAQSRDPPPRTPLKHGPRLSSRTTSQGRRAASGARDL